jgi:hypothetical protein
MTSKTESLTHLVALLALQSSSFDTPDDVIRDAKVVLRESRVLRRWSEAACNGVPEGCGVKWGDEEEKKKERADSRSWSRIRDVAKKYRLAITAQGDPRGWIVKLSDGKNTWGY